MADPAIHMENLGKRYRLGQLEPYETLRDAIARAVRAPFRSTASDPPGSESPPPNLNRDGYVWALRNVSFEVSQGEVLGVIGPNGAGKTTLLKVLSRITEPTEGRAELRGRVGSLLEVGTGFHPELTGRENVYLNGAVLGMKKTEIDDRFDEIIRFAEVEKFVNTPVKRYSTGMQLRLAFAVASHLEPEIMLVDEVLAVGDASFQKKSLTRMGDVAGEGRTVLFVSHNMTAINSLCDRTIQLSDGEVVNDGKTSDVVAQYLRTVSESHSERVWKDPSTAPGNERIRLHGVRIISDGGITGEVDIDKNVSVQVDFWTLAPDIRNNYINIYLLDKSGNAVLSTANTPAANLEPEEWFDRAHPAGLFRATCTIPGNFLNDGLYYISIYVVTLGPLSVEAQAEQVVSFTVFDTGVMREPGAGRNWDGVVRVRLPWHTEFIEPLGQLDQYD